MQDLIFTNGVYEIMKYLSILFILVFSLIASGQISEPSVYKGRKVVNALYINSEYSFSVTPPPGTVTDEEFNKKANFLSTYSCKAPKCVIDGFFSIATIKPLNATGSLVSETFQKESARDKIVSSLVKKKTSDSNSVILSNKYVEINGRPGIRLDYSLTQDALTLVSKMTVIFVEEKKIIIGFGSFTDNSQAEQWHKITDAAISSFTLLPAKDTFTASTTPKEGIATRIIASEPGKAILNYQATTLPKPDYPAAALAVKAIGVVMVQVTVDYSGNVVSAAAISGHPLLQSACVKAARQAKFNPSKTGDNLTGILIYNFEIPAPKH
jgi:TonB family protein